MKNVLATIGIIAFLVPHCLTAQETAGIPQEVMDDWSYFIGDWQVEGQIGDTRVMGTATFKWATGKHSYVGEQAWTIGQRVIHLSLVGGWDSSNNQTVEQGFDSSGGLATTRYEIQSAKDFPASKSGTIDGYSRRGGAWSGATSIQRIGPDKYVLSTTIGGDRLHELTFRKQQAVREDNTDPPGVVRPAPRKAATPNRR